MLAVRSVPFQEELIARLLDHGADINATDVYGTSVLMHALGRTSSHGFVDCISLLLRRGANVFHSNRKGETAIGLAVHGSHVPPAVVVLLLGAGAKLNERYRGSVLMTAFKDKLARRLQNRILRLLDHYEKMICLVSCSYTKAGEQSLARMLHTDIQREVRYALY